MNLIFLIGSIVLLFLGVVHGDKCPPPEDIMPCRCRGRNEQIQVWCSHSDLDRVNGALESLMRFRSMPAIDELIVENNKMPTLPARAFGALRIGRLLLRNNGLESISRNAFAGLENSIEELYIVEDKLLDFPFDSIEQLRNLEAFTIEQSKIRLLPKFSGLNRLKHIRIDGSLISGFPIGAFAKMAAIKQIHIVNSKLLTLAEGIFGPLDTLRLANFSGNQINHVQRRSFALLPKLEVLSLSNNRLQDAVSVGRACEELISLKSLDLSLNSFKTLPEGSFVHLKTLQMLNLAENQIQTVSPRSFTHLPALRKVDLSKNELRNIPKLFFDSSPLLEELRMRKNLLSTGNEIGELLSSLKSLRFLDLGENGITTLQSGTIADHSQLQKVDLSDNLINKIQREAFRNVPSLLELSLRNNSLTELPSLESDVWRIPSLAELDLSTNKIQNLGIPTFSQLPNLVRLDLSYNNIKSIGYSTFVSNGNLEQLEIIGNGLSSIAFNSLTGLLKLKHLDLSRNHLETIQSNTFRDFGKLQVLNLANNRISNVPSDVFNTLKSLEEFSMKGNSLARIPQGLFVAMENLRELNLKQNSIAELYVRIFSDLKNLRSLKISSNQITRIDDAAFDNLYKLKSIDLNSNRISRLPKSAFKHLQALEKFNARENRISIVDNGTFENSEKIQVLDLAHNALVSIPDVIKAPSLKVVDFSHNSIGQLESETLDGSLNLMELYLNDNKIKEMKHHTFKNLKSLTIVDLDGNELTEIRGESFTDLPRLIYLRLSRNKIRVINNQAFVGLSSLDGLDLQQNELESIGESAFERTNSLKYLNLSHNNFDDMTRMGLFQLNSLEVLDLSYNRIRIFNEKALRHLQWLVELRVNDNGICHLPIRIFDGMSRLKMLVLKNNSISTLNEHVFHKVKSNIAFLDVSGNPLNCDCELIWFRNLMSRENVQELTESICDSPNELHGIPIKSLRPGRMICSNTNNNRLRGIPTSKYNEQNCPNLTTSKRKPRPVLSEPFEKPVFADTNPTHVISEQTNDSEYIDNNGNIELKNNRRHKDEKFLQSHDYIPGDSPTIYAGSITSLNKVHEPDSKVSSGLSALSTLFGIPIPNLDFGLNLGISPSVSIADKSSDDHDRDDDNRGFAPGIKGPDPLPPSWLDRPSKVEPSIPLSYDPPEYIPRKPIQPYIPLNPFAETNTQSHFMKPKVRSKSQSSSLPTLPSYSSRFTVTNLPQTSWHPSYPTVETGFIPIEPFFHSAVNKVTNQRKKTTTSTSINPFTTNSRYETTTPSYEFTSSAIRNELNTPTETPFLFTTKVYNDEVTDGVDADRVHEQSNDDETEAEENDDDSPLSDFWGMFSSRKNATNSDIPLDFSDPVDTDLIKTDTPSTTTMKSYTEAEVDTGGVSHQNPPYSTPQYSPQDPRKLISKGKSTITKVKLDENRAGNRFNNPKTPSTNALINNERNGNYLDSKSDTLSPRKSPPLVPPVLIGGYDEPLDWYYKNYNVEQNPEEEIEKYLERSRINQVEEKLIDNNMGSSSASVEVFPSITLQIFISTLTILLGRI